MDNVDPLVEGFEAAPREDVYEVPGDRLRELRKAEARVAELEKAVASWTTKAQQRQEERREFEHELREVLKERSELRARVAELQAALRAALDHPILTSRPASWLRRLWHQFQ